MKSFEELFEDCTSQGTKIKKEDYLEQGKYVIVDQGQDYISGYTNIEEGLYEEIPAIIFGDHTRIIKYVDRPFFLGADGVKLLKCKKKNANYKYLYYALRSVKIPDTGYNRHFKWLKEVKIKYPDTLIQDKVVKILEIIEKIIVLKRQEIEELDTLIKSRFVELFGNIYEERFETKTLPQIVVGDKNSIKRGPFGGTLKKDDFVEHGYLVYEQRHAIHNDFQYEKYYITKEKYEEMIGFKVVSGDLIVSCSGVTLGRIAEVPQGAKEGIINQALLKLTLDQSIMMNTFFINQFRSDEIQEVLFGFSRGSGIPNMPSMSEVKSVKFICPPIELQKQYCDFVHQVDKSKVAIRRYA